MQVQPINNVNFESKNTFLTKSKNAVTKQDKNYWKSLHYEAKSRLKYQKFQKADEQLSNVEDTGSLYGMLTLISLFSIMALRKLQSILYLDKSYNIFPNRFSKPDDFNVKEFRHYKIKDNYNH